MFSLKDEIREIESFSELEPDWDGYGGLPITPKAISKGKSISRVIVPYEFALKNVAPLTDGGLEFEMNNNWQGSMMIVVEPKGNIRYIICDDRIDYMNPKWCTRKGENQTLEQINELVKNFTIPTWRSAIKKRKELIC